MNEHEEWLTVTEACIALDKSEKDIRRMIAHGDLRSVKTKTDTGQEWRVSAEDVARHAGQVPERAGVEMSIIHTNATDGGSAWDVSDAQEAHNDRGQMDRSASVIQSMQAFIAGQWSTQVQQIIERSVGEAIAAAQAPLLHRIEELSAEIATLREERRELVAEALQPVLKHLASQEIHLQTLTGTQALQPFLELSEAHEARMRADMEHVYQSVHDRLDKVATANESLRVQLANLEMALARGAGQGVSPPSGVQVDESTGQMIESVIDEALDKSLLPYLRQVQEVSSQVDEVHAENQRLRVELERAQHPWWKLW